MKRKTIYLFILICCLGMLSSANQNDKNCGRTAICFSEKAKCCPGASTEKEEQTDSPAMPLNLFLFDL
ncbi:MAG: hypothetical protein WDO19_28005 [Bacteroidota bacterium]